MSSRAHGALVLGFILPNDADIDKEQYFNEDVVDEDEDDGLGSAVFGDIEEKFQFVSAYSEDWDEDDILFIKRIESQEYEITPITAADLVISDDDRWALEAEAERLGVINPKIQWHLVGYNF